ncbi:MAG: glutathione S-transferase family protein [Myxococcales bacterium]|nr:glutathione S-transferase family protein [Myxococcales bacterium]
MPSILLHQFGPDLGVESASPFCVKVHRALGLKGLSYSVNTVGGPSEMKRINPEARKVPALAYEDEIITDSSRILSFIEARHPEPRLWPEDERERAQARLIEDWADESLYWFAVHMRWAIDSNFEPFRRRAFGQMPIPLRWFVPGLIRRQVRAQLEGQGIGRISSERVLELLGEHVATLTALLERQPFLAGETISAADLAVFGPLRAMAIREASPEAAAIVRAHSALRDWLARVDRATQSEHTVPFEA